MIPFLTHTTDILGLNARNLLYIQKYNSRAHKKLANDKIYTKNFLESRNIKVAKTYHVIKSYKELTPAFFKNLPDTFVLKPNKGWGGNGILIIEKRKEDRWITSSGKTLNLERLFQHCVAILDGKYSLSGIDDVIIFEEKLEKHPSLRYFNDIGLPDIRLIVFNMVPIMAMIRIPTEDSDGKANMEIGGIGVGIDIGTGITTRAAQYVKSISRMPNGNSVSGFHVPHWNELLLNGAKIQNTTGIGYIGVDFVLTKTGLKVLEINTLPGLKIQVANKIPLKRRLEKVHDLKIKTPEEGVEIAKTLFTQKVTAEKTDSIKIKEVIGVTESVIVNMEKPLPLIAHIDTLAEKNTIRSTLYSGGVLDITIGKKRLKLPVEKSDSQEHDIILASKFLHDFYIDPNKKPAHPIGNPLTAQLDEKMMIKLDEKVFEMERNINLLRHVNPQNLEEQRELFLRNPEFSPKFVYKPVTDDLSYFEKELKKIPKINHPLFCLFEAKVQELHSKIHLIQNIGSPLFQDASEKMFGRVSTKTYKEAIQFCKKNPLIEDPSKELDIKSSRKIITEFLNLYNLGHWNIKIINESVADIQVTKGGNILLRDGAVFKENRLKALLVHEVGTHIFRFENGRNQRFRIFERGTAGYLRTEEGLAIWNQNQLGLQLGTKYLSPAHQVIAIYKGQSMSFLDLFHSLKKEYQFDDKRAWKMCLRSKRGLTDTSQKQSFTKDAVYFQGNQDIEAYISKGKKIEDLYIGKISIDDIPLLKTYPDIKKPKLLLSPKKNALLL